MFVALRQELRFALRALARTPWFTAISVLMLAAGIGLSLYMFGAINGFVLKPMPFADAERLMFVAYADPTDPDDEFGVPVRDFIEIRAAQTRFEDLAGYYEGTVNLSDGERPERFDGIFATASLFPLLGVAPQLGRALAEDDSLPGAAPVAVISHNLWLTRFNGDPGVIGRGVRVNGKPATVVGVMPHGFRFPRRHDVWVPISYDFTGVAREADMSLEAFGKLRPGATIAQARAELDAQLARINAEHPTAQRSDRGLIRPFAEELVNVNTRQVLYTMFAAVLLVLLIACANVANLMVARGAARGRETAIRGALGADRWRLVSQVLAESMLIAFAASLIGLAGAQVGGEITMRHILASEDPPVYWVSFAIDGTGIAFAVGIALFSALLAALLPAWHAWRMPAGQAMRAGGSGSIGRGGRLGKALVVVEVALCMVLLVGAGLTVRSVLHLQTYDLGVDTRNLLTGRVGLFESAYPTPADRLRFVETLQRRLESVPGVTSASLSTSLPSMDMGRNAYLAEGDEVPAGNQFDGVWASWVTPSYFETFAFRPHSGRALGPDDRADTTLVAVINDAFAHRVWPGESPLGKRFKLDPNEPDSAWITVVGIVPDTVQGELQFERREAVFLPMAQEPARFMSFAVKTQGDPYAYAEAVRDAVQIVDADLPVYWLRSMDDWLDIAMWDSRLLARLFGIFATFALVLAVSGIYAVLAYAVSQRTREIGVRRALGAQDVGIVRMVLNQGLVQIAVGLGFGVVLALGFARLLANVLFEVSSFDPATFLGVAVVLAGAAAAASLLPTRRALRVEPMAALRYE